MKAMFVWVGILLSCTSVSGIAEVPSTPIPIQEFHEVIPGIYRGARPGPEGLQALRELGVKTNINLDDDRESNDQEELWTQALGIEYIARPLSGFWAPSDQTVDEILAKLADTKLYPLFIHCAHGQDRTGLLIGLFRVFQQNWAPNTAYDEMLKYHFHSSLFLLDRYFKKRTHWNGSLEAYP